MIKVNRKFIMYLVIAIGIMYLLTSKPEKYTPGQWTVYGTKGCGWTRKQLDYMKKKKIPHNFIDCDKQKCGKISAYPTMKDPNGKTITGFKQVQ
jgi:hypothetical protein